MWGRSATPPARGRDLIGLWLLIHKANPVAADRFLQRIEARIEILRRFPEAGQRRRDIAPDARVLVEPPCLILYRLIPEGVQIVRVLHGARRIGRALFFAGRMTRVPLIGSLMMENTRHSIAPIRDEAGHRAALAEIERLWGAAAGTPDGDRLDVLMALVDDYERPNWPDEDLDPVDAIIARMENSGRTRKDFEKLIGSSGRASEILNRRRHLTPPMIWRLVQEWKMPAEILVRPYKLSVQRTASGRAPGRVRTTP